MLNSLFLISLHVFVEFIICIMTKKKSEIYYSQHHQNNSIKGIDYLRVLFFIIIIIIIEPRSLKFVMLM